MGGGIFFIVVTVLGTYVLILCADLFFASITNCESIRSGWEYTLKLLRRVYPTNVIPQFLASFTDIELGDVREMTMEVPIRADFCIISELIRPVVIITRLAVRVPLSKQCPDILSSVL